MTPDEEQEEEVDLFEPDAKDVAPEGSAALKRRSPRQEKGCGCFPEK